MHACRSTLEDPTRILYRRRWLIIAIVVAGLSTGALIDSTTEPVFEGRATLQLDTDVNVLGVDRPLMPVDQRDWMREFVPTQLGVLQSRELARIVHEELKRQESTGENGASDQEHAHATPAPTEGVHKRVPTVGEIIGGRSVNLVRDSRLVNIGFRSTDPELAASVPNALARAYVQQTRLFRAKTTGDASEWLEQQVANQRKLLAATEDALQRYRTVHQADALFTDKLGTEQQNIVVQKLAALQAAVTKARTETIDKEALYKQLAATQANRESVDTVPAIAANSFIQRSKAELSDAQQKLAQASKELGERHPELIKLQEAVRTAEQRVQTEMSNAAAAIRNDFEAARSREQALLAALDRQKLEVRTLNSKAVEYTALDREVTTNRELLDKLLQRSREASLARELQTTNIRIVDWAEVPEWPVLPNARRTMTAALVASLALALGVVFVSEVFNTRVQTPDDVKRHLGMSVIGLLPRVKSNNGRASLLVGNGAPVRYAELFRDIRTNLVSVHDASPGRTILVTSSEPQEGKTVSAANLAVSLAGLRQRVLLIDADLRKPSLHEVFGEELQPGLAEVLTGKATTAGFRRTRTPGLWLLPAGTTSQNPGDLLGSSAFSTFIERLRTHFDWIVLDSPPVLAVTDPCLLARVASDVLLVVNCGHTPRDVASAAIERLDAVGTAVVRVLLNQVELDQRANSYLPYYHQTYKAYYSEPDDGFLPPEISATSLKADADAAARAPLKT